MDALHDNTKWIHYAQQLTIDSAQWIAKYGNAIEKANLTQQGTVSRRAMLAVLVKRAQLRGEKLGLFKGKDSAKFLKKVSEGNPIYDKGAGGIARHGELPHLLQMDFMAPYLKEIFGNNTAQFYQEITAIEDYDPFLGTYTSKWEYTFDKQLTDKSKNTLVYPDGITKLLGKVLPLSKDAPP